MVMIKFDDCFLFNKFISFCWVVVANFYIVCGVPIPFVIVIHWLNYKCCLALSTSYKAIKFTHYLS